MHPMLQLVMSRCGDALSEAEKAKIEDALSGVASFDGEIGQKVWTAIDALETRLSELEQIVCGDALPERPGTVQ
jgi:hypothetical protein